MKYCSNCKETKNLSLFTKKRNASGVQSHCKRCRADKEQERRKDPEYQARIKQYKLLNKRATKNAALKRLFGITIDIYEEMHKNQNGLCVICKKPEVSFKIKSLSVDHCHKTGFVRGLLCTNCNQGIGHFFDNVDLMNNAIKYIKQSEVDQSLAEVRKQLVEQN